jgi:hypothetical protein
MYTEIASSGGGTILRRDADGATIPRDPGNIDYQRYKVWLGEGNKPAKLAATVAPPEVISDRQFAQALAKQGVISKDEALAFVKRGEVPPALQAVIDSVSDDEERFDLDMAVSGATTFERSNPSTESLAAALGWSSEQMDDLWTYAASIR